MLVTGHTGFKGGWLTFWLTEMGAEVAGIGLAPSDKVSFFDLLSIGTRCRSEIADINKPGRLAAIIADFEPEIIIHMAAQALVRASYADPIGTYDTNVTGVVRLLDAVRHIESVRSVVVVTSDKCYDNREQIWGYREGDPLGGHDPYSSSKGAAEIAARSMQLSYFQPYAEAGHPARIATVRAGNVIGGGDWSQDRLVPDIVRGLLGPSGRVLLRNPNAVRPWQHVLEPVAAYLEIARRMIENPQGIDEAWNIGPNAADTRAVVDVATAMQAALACGVIEMGSQPDHLHEATLLALDCTKARVRLGWSPKLNFDACVQWTAGWYADWHSGSDMVATTRNQIVAFETLSSQHEQANGTN